MTTIYDLNSEELRNECLKHLNTIQSMIDFLESQGVYNIYKENED